MSDSAEAAEWHKAFAADLGYTKSSYGGRYWMVWQGERLVASQIAQEADADRIIADHRKAAKADAVLVKALKQIGCASDRRSPSQPVPGCTCTRCAALAEWAEVAAPEEAQGWNKQ